jgi:ketosteroid isomerase-like protein
LFLGPEKEHIMKPSNIFVIVSLFCVLATGSAHAQTTTDVEGIHVATQSFIGAIAARDIDVMDRAWTHESYSSFIGPLSKTVVVGWEDVRKAWQMRFGQFDRVAISADKPHVHTDGKVGWAVGMESVELLRKDGKIIRFDAFVTNVFVKKDGRWLIVAHQATPVFKPPE